VGEEEILGECQALLHDFSLQDQVPNTWQWQPDPVRGYSVSDAYKLLTTQQNVTLNAAEDLIWHKQVPLKVSIFARRLLRDKLPTKTNLVACNMITPAAHFCVPGCGGVKLAQHLFLLQLFWFNLVVSTVVD
jgi:hypothetical protein